MLSAINHSPSPSEVQRQNRKQAQRELMSAISDALVAVDRSGALLFENNRFTDLFPSIHTERTIENVFVDTDILDAFDAALTSGENANVKTLTTHTQGVTRFFSLSVSPLLDPENTITGAIGIFHDVTDLKKAEQIRIDFVANVSHELRTPLTAIKGYTDTLRNDLAAGLGAAPEFIDAIIRNTGRLMNLINDLLDLSLLDANADHLHRSEVSTEELTSRVINQMKGRTAAKHQTIDVHYNTSTVWADGARLEQVLVNLLDNAHKYTPDGGRITAAWSQSVDGEHVLLTVADSGPGIPSEHHARLFERFYRVDKARSRDLGGTGLGLAIVKHIMSRHGGSVHIESTPGHGATFYCKFPETF